MPEREGGPVSKGEKGGKCNVTSCTNTNAKYYNHSTRMYYCESCAVDLNHYNKKDAIRLYGHDLCTLDDVPNPSGPPDPPRCRHGKAGRNCPECRTENEQIKKLVHPLIDEWWKSKGENISLYHYIFQAYHMGMRKEHLK